MTSAGSISGSVPGTRESFITAYGEMTPWTWGEESEDYNGLKVRLVDISLGGLMFCTREEFKVNDRFNIVIPAMGDSMLFICGAPPGGTPGGGIWLWLRIRGNGHKAGGPAVPVYSQTAGGSAAENTVGQRDERRDC